MCGRYVLDMGRKEVAELYNGQDVTPPLLKLEIYPSSVAPVFVHDCSLPKFCKWGFDGPRNSTLLVNARAETVTQKPFFAKDFENNRCAIPCSGFFEWDDDKNKHLFARTDYDMLYLAGFCKQQDTLRYIVLTKNATPPVCDVHSRIPLLLSKNTVKDFLFDNDFAVHFLTKANTIPLKTVY